MADYRPSIVDYYSMRRRNHCGYCSSKDGSCSYGLHAHTMRVEDYQNMIDRGWRRCGQYCYKSIMNSTCCPLYTIRCAAKDFRLSRSQKKIIKRFNNFLVNGTITKDIKERVVKKTEIGQPMEIHHLSEECRNKDEKNLTISSVDASINNTEKAQEANCFEKGQNELPVEVKKSDTLPTNEQKKKNKCMKAKFLRIERKKQKLQKLGITEEQIAKKLVEKKKYPVVKTIEDYLNESLTENPVHNLKITLVRSYPQSEAFDNTFDDAFKLYIKYQRFIHKDPHEKLTRNQYERFLVISPLQVNLVLVNSPEFEKSFRESLSLFAKYQKTIHNESEEDCDVVTFNDFLVNSPLEASVGYGSYHQQYWLDDKLIAVGVIDILPKCVSSVYFFYDPDYSYLSLGTYGALREVEFTRMLSKTFPDLTYYYMGFYIHSCVKMKYKGAFKPSYLLCPEVYTWHPIKECLPKLDRVKYSRLNDDPQAVDVNLNPSLSEILILYNRTAMSLAYYYKQKKCDMEERDEIMEYARLVGKSCSKNMLLFRK